MHPSLIRAATATLATAICLFGGIPCRAQADPEPAQSRLGINLNGPADWNSEIPFVDVFRLSREWISQREGAGWGKGPGLSRDKSGWVTKLEPNCWAETPMLTIANGRFPAGEYVVLYEGTGKIVLSNVDAIVSEAPGRIVFRPKAGSGGFFLRLSETDPNDHVRNIRVLLPGCEKTYTAEPFRAEFLKRWSGFNTIRFMDWALTNGSPQRDWADRPTPEYCNFTEKGVPVEVMVDLCNRLKANAWFCVPHAATDDYVRRLAELVKAKLDPSLRVHIEYSNEVWNGMFPQTAHSVAQAKALGLGPKERPWEGGGMYYARRSVEIFRIWEQVFGGRERLVRVLSWQAVSPWWTENIILPSEDACKSADALAIAPYFAMLIGPQTTPNSDTVAGWTVDRVLDYTENTALPEALKAVAGQKRAADKFGLRLVAYEAGQHLVGVGGGENNEKMTALFLAANRHPRMGALYTKYLDAWKAAGGDLMCLFASTGGWSKWGSWGLTEYYDETEADQPKLKAVTEWNRANPL